MKPKEIIFTVSFLVMMTCFCFDCLWIAAAGLAQCTIVGLLVGVFDKDAFVIIDDDKQKKSDK